MKHIDLHCHLAWDLDDGISSEKDCSKLLIAAKKDHIVKIAATPHLICGKHTQSDIFEFQNRIHELKELAKEQGIEIYQGCELHINDMLFQQLQNNLVIPIENTSYVLCEFNVRKIYDEDYDLIFDYLYELVLAGYTPILAHVERYFSKKISITDIQNIVDMGCILQTNTSSILYPKNKLMKKNVFDLLNHNLIHIIATDSHNYEGKRSPNMSQTFSFLCRFYDKANLELLFYQNPLAILSGGQITKTQFKKYKPSVWRLFK